MAQEPHKATAPPKYFAPFGLLIVWVGAVGHVPSFSLYTYTSFESGAQVPTMAQEPHKATAHPKYLDPVGPLIVWVSCHVS